MQGDHIMQRESIRAVGQTTMVVAPHPPAVRIHELDGLRGVLALLVVAFHLTGPFDALREVLSQYANIILQAWYAVDVFFLMSGFVMMHVYAATFVERPGWNTFWQFMRARVARLYPVHVAAMVVLLAIMLPLIYHLPDLYAWSGRYSLGAFAGSLLMLHGPWIDYRSWNYPAWSISAEWHAYLLFPLLVPLARKCGRRAALAALAVCTLIPFFLYLQDLPPDQYPTNGILVLLRVFPLFFGGMLLYSLFELGGKGSGNGGAEPGLGSGLLAALVVAGTLVLLCFDGSAPYAVLLAPLLIMVALQGNWLQASLRHSTLLFLGKISYSLYMTHALVETSTRILVRSLRKFTSIDPYAHWQSEFLLWACGIVVALVLGYLTCNWIEQPARKWLMRRNAPA